MQVQARSATRHDIEALQCIGTNVWIETYAERGLTADIACYVGHKFCRESIESLLSDPKNQVQVATVFEHVVGYGVTKNSSPCPVDSRLTTEIATLYVLRKFHGIGVGTALLTSLTSPASLNTPVAPTWLRVNSRNQQALEFYKTVGYLKVGSIWVDFDGEKNENYILATSDA